MKIYKVVLTVIDHDGLGDIGIKETLEDTKYPNYCMYPAVHSVEGVDIGEWSDEHPLNHADTAPAELRRLFGL